MDSPRSIVKRWRHYHWTSWIAATSSNRTCCSVSTPSARSCGMSRCRRYADEASNLRVSHVAFSFPGKYASLRSSAFSTHIFCGDFNAGTLQLCFGAVITGAGIVYGTTRWIHSAITGVVTTSGAVMLAALPVIIGTQLLLGALNYDVQNIPREPLQLMTIRSRRTRRNRGRGQPSDRSA